ncbi:MAG TPA: retropepsin-like aspartic protease [Candidatus Avamphibacillus sp.]|nr:retropepsin-like aspartic protease [Candidatus Avamphibacillus sp.]
MKIKYEKGLILAGILIEFRGATKTISNMVIDTGAARTLISQDVVEDIGVNVTTHDAIVTYYGIGGKEHAFRKEVDRIQINDYSFKNIQVDFNDFGYDDINGLLGLDLLKEAGFLIDLHHLRLQRNALT